MLIYDFSGRGTHPLYEYLYHCLKADILNWANIPAGTKLAVETRAGCRQPDQCAYGHECL